MFFIDFDPFLFFLMGFDCFEHDGGRCGWGTVWMGTALNKFDLIGCVFIGRELRQVGQRGAQRFPISAQSGVKLVYAPVFKDVGESRESFHRSTGSASTPSLPLRVLGVGGGRSSKDKKKARKDAWEALHLR